MPAPQTQVSINLTGTSSVPDNFTIKIYPWDSTTDAVSSTSRTYATGVSRTTTSAINGGTLMNGYGISPIYQNDYQIELISTTSCTTSALINVNYPTDTLFSDEQFLQQIKSIYQPSLFAITENHPNVEQPIPPDTIFSQSGYFQGNNTLGTLEVLPYLPASGFTIQAGTQYIGNSNNTEYGVYQYGPFSSFTILKEGKILTLKGNANTALPSTNSGTTYRGTFRLTHDLSGEFSDFTYCYVPGPV